MFLGNNYHRFHARNSISSQVSGAAKYRHETLLLSLLALEALKFESACFGRSEVEVFVWDMVISNRLSSGIV